MYDILEMHNFQSGYPLVELVQMTKEGRKYIKKSCLLLNIPVDVSKYMIFIDDDGNVIPVSVQGINMNSLPNAQKAYKKFLGMLKKRPHNLLTYSWFVYITYDYEKNKVYLKEQNVFVSPDSTINSRPKPKPEPKPDEFFALIPKATDGNVKVMKVKPPKFILDYSYVEGPFSTVADVKLNLNRKKIPNMRRPKEFWEEY